MQFCRLRSHFGSGRYSTTARYFDDELDLAYAVIHGVEARSEKANYSTQRVKFNSYATA
ncbi:hypothetical protein NSTC745_04020 [Nostoc sp. DSM 114161]|jgi:hypothetical protein|uniref:hypothetical protein n=1 Tax=Nostoc sp. DSM 114161 TaxID=3440143 RepID=UPI004045A7AB